MRSGWNRAPPASTRYEIRLDCDFPLLQRTSRMYSLLNHLLISTRKYPGCVLFRSHEVSTLGVLKSSFGSPAISSSAYFSSHAYGHPALRRRVRADQPSLLDSQMDVGATGHLEARSGYISPFRLCS